MPKINTARIDNLKIIQNKDFAELMITILEHGKSFRFQARGGSMSPFIKDQDIIRVKPILPEKIHTGDILAFINPDQQKLNVHRVVVIKNGKFCMKGDSVHSPDGWIERDQIIGIVDAIERGGKAKKMGLGFEKFLVAYLSQKNVLLPTIRVLWRLFPPALKRRIR